MSASEFGSDGEDEEDVDKDGDASLQSMMKEVECVKLEQQEQRQQQDQVKAETIDQTPKEPPKLMITPSGDERNNTVSITGPTASKIATTALRAYP
ncbi:hypothetical protein BGW42_004744 [Actinomortierella wolfii]|nr:hypothetical protein BGW42_004744 [Actinomortierella wolfii]